VPNDQPDQPGAQVVGHCANDTFKITYTRSADSDSDARNLLFSFEGYYP
jgi:hypothetical protein